MEPSHRTSIEAFIESMEPFDAGIFLAVEKFRGEILSFLYVDDDNQPSKKMLRC